ncbi:MAG TPA: hypothetical protein EYG02_03530 [Henriciella marina]|uniref:hypothetical protein n=1 Tax=Henriciella sp. TaxID=1968823 RepID=UPI00185C2F36|nr:hypothetical protein [Henriciella sp.]HIG23743.1 hypothetical protein [Henriciella sp.]HIK64086.1 hypothetical protein [Henriciella marina]
MIYFRSSKDGLPGRAMSQTLTRILATLPLIAYPAGCILMLNANDRVAIEIAGFALILVALIGFAMIAPSWIQRITGEEKVKLDEFEMDVRRRAYSAAYHGFTALALIFVVYLGIVSDAQAKLGWLWTPTTFDHWNAIFWGAFLYATLLPTVWIAWTVRAPDHDID